MARHVNDVFLSKVGLGLCSENSKLWVQVVRGKYGCGDGILPLINPKHNGYNVWFGIY